MPKVRSAFLTIRLWLCVHLDTYLMPSGQEERCGLWSEFVLWCLNEWTACKSKFTSTVRSSEQLCHRSPQFSAVDRSTGFPLSFPAHLRKRLNSTCGRQTSELSLRWPRGGIMGSVLPEPLGVSFLLPLLPWRIITAMAVRQSARSPTATPPTTVTRLTSEVGRLSSRGRTPSGGTLPWGICFLLLRSRAMCWMFVPRLFSAPISHTSGGVLLISLFFRLLEVAWGFPLLTREWYWYSTLRLPRPRLALSLDLTV